MTPFSNVTLSKKIVRRLHTTSTIVLRLTRHSHLANVCGCLICMRKEELYRHCLIVPTNCEC